MTENKAMTTGENNDAMKHFEETWKDFWIKEAAGIILKILSDKEVYKDCDTGRNVS